MVLAIGNCCDGGLIMMHIANISAYHRFLRLLRTAGGRLFFVVAAAAFALAAQPQTANAKPMIMKLGTATVNDVQVEAIKRFAKRVEKRTNGKIKGKIFPGAQLGSNARMIEGLQLGTLEVYVGPPAYLVGVDPRFQILDVPGIFTDMQHAWRTIQDEEFRKVFLALGMKKGLVGVSLFIYSPTSFATKVPIRTLADFKGKKLRVMASEMEQIGRAHV